MWSRSGGQTRPGSPHPSHLWSATCGAFVALNATNGPHVANRLAEQGWEGGFPGGAQLEEPQLAGRPHGDQDATGRLAEELDERVAVQADPAAEVADQAGLDEGL